MSKLWKVEIPFDSSNRFPDMLKTMLLFFDKTVVRLPMIGAGEPFYNKNVWGKVWPDVFQLYRLKYFDCRYVPAFNELDMASKIIHMASDVIASDCKADGFDSEFRNYLEMMDMDHVDGFLASCCPEDDDPAVTWAMKSSTLHFQQRTFQLWIEEESYKNADGPKASTGLINDENNRPLLLPMCLSSTPYLEMQRPGVEEDQYTSSVMSGLDVPDTHNYPSRLNGTECNGKECD